MGGLGNQMFQYAFALIHMLGNKEVKFDLSYYDSDNRHGGYWLDKAFNINIAKANKRDVFYFIEAIKDEVGNLGYRLKSDKFIIEEVLEEESSYNPDLANLDGAHFSGYWQNVNYFKKIENEVRHQFRFRELEKADLGNLANKKQILDSNAVSIHIRRGDYLQSPIHLNLGLEYYANAIEYIEMKTNEPWFYIFTDDMHWAKQNLGQVNNIQYVETNKKNKCHLDMYLMSLCKQIGRAHV